MDSEPPLVFRRPFSKDFELWKTQEKTNVAIVIRMKELERENRQLKQANEILRKASAFFAAAELDRTWKK